MKKKREGGALGGRKLDAGGQLGMVKKGYFTLRGGSGTKSRPCNF